MVLIDLILKNDLLCPINDSCIQVEGELVEEATNRLFKIGDKFILSDLK